MKIRDLFEAIPPELGAFRQAFNSKDIIGKTQAQSARKNPKWKRALVSAMSKYGFSLIGAGINGAAFANPALPYIIKIYRKDSGYNDWLYFVRRNQQNRFVPKLRGRPVSVNSVFDVIRMERLEPCELTAANTLCDEIERMADTPWTKKDEIAAFDPDMHAIAKVIRDAGPHSDLTAHNIMQRPNGELVIIDPIYVDPDYDGDW